MVEPLCDSHRGSSTTCVVEVGYGGDAVTGYARFYDKDGNLLLTASITTDVGNPGSFTDELSQVNGRTTTVTVP